jgi:hypothetical protein
MGKLDYLFDEKKEEPSTGKLDYLFDNQAEAQPSGAKMEYLFDTNLDYATDESSPYTQMMRNRSSSIFSPEEEQALREQGPIGIGEAFERQNKWDLLPMSPAGLIDAMGIKNAVKRLQDDEYGEDWVSRKKDEESVMEFARKIEEERIRGFKWGAKVYNVASHMPAFMGEFYISGGAVSLAKGAIRKGALTAAKGAAKAGAGRVAKKVAKGAATLAAETAVRTPVMYNLYGKRYNERQIFANISLTDKGVSILEAPTESQATSFVKAYGDAFIEVGSEMLGAKAFKPIGGAIGRKLAPGKGAITKHLSPEVKAGMKKFMKWISADGKITRAFKKGGFDGIIEEVGEEIVGDQLRAAFNIEDFGEEDGNIIDRMRAAVPGFDDLSVMVAAFSIPGVSSLTSQNLYNEMIKRGKSAKEAKMILEYTSASEQEKMHKDFTEQKSAWLRAAVKKALAGEDLTNEEKYGLNEKFYEYLDQGEIDVKESEKGSHGILHERKGDKAVPVKDQEFADKIVEKLIDTSETFEQLVQRMDGQNLFLRGGEQNAFAKYFEERKDGKNKLTFTEWRKGKPSKEVSDTEKAKAVQAVDIKLQALESLRTEAEEFKSNALAVVAEKIEDDMPSDKVWSILSKKSNLKAEELAYSGLTEEFIRSKKSWKKEDLLKYVNANKVRIDIKYKGAGFKKLGFNTNSKYYQLPAMRRMIEAFERSSDTDEYQFRLMLENDGVVYQELQQFPEIAAAMENEDLGDWADMVMNDLVDLKPMETKAIEHGINEAREILNRYGLSEEKQMDMEDFADRAYAGNSTGFAGLEEMLQDIGEMRSIQEIGEDFMEAEGVVSESESRWEEYTLKGGENYMEVLVTLPTTTKNQEAIDRMNELTERMRVAEREGDFGLQERLAEEIAEIKEQVGERKSPRDRLGDPRITMTEDWEEGDPIRVKLEEKRVTKVFEYVQHDVNGVSPTIELTGLEDEQMAEYKAFAPGGETFTSTVLADAERWLADQVVPETFESTQQAPDLYFKRGHWEEANVLFFMRLNFREDQEGNKVLFIEELQSDWHGEAREARKNRVHEVAKEKGITVKEAGKLVPKMYGYKSGIGEAPYSKEQLAKLKNDAEVALRINDNLGFNYTSEAKAAILETDDWMNAWEFDNPVDQNAVSAWRAAYLANKRFESKRGSAVPDAPMKDTWRELGVKKAIDLAVKYGADKVAWINGEQSAKRYNLWTHFEELKYQKKKNGNWYLFAKSIDESKRNVEEHDLTDQEMIERVGQDNFDRMLAEEGDKTISDSQFKDLEDRGKGIKVYQKKYEVKKVQLPDRVGWFWRIFVNGEIDKRNPIYDTKAEAQGTLDNIGYKDSWFIGFEDGSEMGTWISEEDAQRALEQNNYDYFENPSRVLKVDELRKGGEAHLAMYDQILPTIAKKYIKKWDSKVEMIDLSEGEQEEGEAVDLKKPGKQMGFEITPMMKLEVQEIGQPMFGSKLAEGVKGEDAVVVPKLVEDAIEESTPEGAKKLTKQTRMQKYRAMASRITEILTSKADLKEKKAQAKEVLDYFTAERKQYTKRIRRYADGKLDEEYNELPKAYRSTKGIALDEVASEIGVEGDMEARDYLIDLENNYLSAKEAVSEINDQIKQANEKKVFQTELQNLKQRVTDFAQGRKQGTKDVADFRSEATTIARKLLPAQGKRYFNKILTAIKSIKKEEDVGPAVAIMVDNYENYLDRWIRAKAVKKILKRYKKPQNIMDVKYREKIQKMLDENSISVWKSKAKAKRKALELMTTDELVTMARRVSRLVDAGKLSKAKKDEMRQMAREIMRGAAIVAAGGKVDIENIGSLEEIKKARLGSVQRQALKWKYGFARPLRMIRSIFGEFGERMFYDVVEKAETLAQHLKIKRLTRIDKIMKKNKVKLFDLGKTVTIDGATFQVNNLMTMKAQQNNAEGRAAIINGNKISEETYEKFINYLEREYPGAAKAVDEIKVVVGERYEDLRKTMADTFNVSLAKVEDYFPISRARFDRKDEKDPDAIMGMDIVGEAVMKRGHGVNYTAVEKGLTISRKNIEDHNQLPISLNFMEDAARAIDNQEHLIHFAGVQKMYNTVKTDKDMRDAVRYNHGQQAWDSFDRWMNEAINPRSAYQGLGFWGERAKQARRSLGVFYLGFNVITAMKQFPSAHLALKYTNPMQLYSSMFTTLFNKAAQKRILELDPSIAHRIVEREIGEIMQGASKLYRNDFMRQAQIAEQWLGEKSMKMILNMDRWAVMSVFDAVYKSNVDRLGHEGAVDMAHKALLETQPQGRRIDLPEEYRTNDQIWRMMLMFTNQLNQIYNMMAFDSKREWQAGEKGRMMIGLASIMLSNLMIYGVSHGGWDWPEDDDEQWAAWMEVTMGSALSSIPVAGNLAMSKVRGYTPQLLVGQSVIDNIGWDIKKFQNEQYAEATFDIMVDVAVLAGVKVPYGALKRSIKGVQDIYDGETDDLRRAIWSKSALYE